LISFVPSSNWLSNVSKGKSPDSIASTIDSSFFKASSNGSSLLGLATATVLEALAMGANLG
jgi:hypothetical protein